MATPTPARVSHDFQIVGGSEILSLAEGRSRRHVRIIDLPADAHRAMPNSALETFVRLSGGNCGRIVIIPLATSDVLAYGRSFARNLAAHGAGMVSVLQLTERWHAEDPNAISAIDSATGILLAADNQASLAVLLEGTALLQRIRQRNQQGIVLAITSAATPLFAIPLGPPIDLLAGESTIGF
jgi:cyanophycinase-like exopeptidase